jgi:hypothetical protein
MLAAARLKPCPTRRFSGGQWLAFGFFAKGDEREADDEG